MSIVTAFWLSLALKMAITACLVVTASVVAERAGAAIGALIATLPVAAGPSYVFLSLDHDPGFIADGAVASLVVNAATAIFVVVYSALAQRLPLAASLPGALAVWASLIALAHRVEWSIASAAVLNAIAFLVSIVLARRYLHAAVPFASRRWYDLPLRALMVACLVATVVGLSSRVGPTMTGVLATFPIVLTSLIIILQPRLGGPATAAIIANTLPGLIGFGAAVVVLHLAAVPLGSPAALSLALATSIVWNLLLWLNGRRRIAARRAAAAR